MSYFKDLIKKEGVVVGGNILKVDSFLNHQIDPKVMDEVSTSFYDYFKDQDVSKVLTIEASGIAPALATAAKLEVPMVFAKKMTPSTMTNDKYVTTIHSFTKDMDYRAIVSKRYLNADDRVLIIDDFLATGSASLGLIDLVHQAGGQVVGVGICVEKTYESGREKLEKAGVNVYSVARISSLADNQVHFVEDSE